MRKYIDLHCDTLSRLFCEPALGNLFENNCQVDIKRLAADGCCAQIFACFVEKTDFSGISVWDDGYAYAGYLLDLFDKEMSENKETIGRILKAEDILTNESEGKLSAIVSVEEGGILNGDIKRIDALYKRGVRLMTLTWNFENCIGYSNSNDANIMARGLKGFGFEVLERMNDIGMIIDVSHLSDGGFYDVAQYARKTGIPFVASHSCARALTEHPRNLTDDMLKLIGDTGSVAGVNFFHEFTTDTGFSDVESIVRHTVYMIDKAGEDAVCIGSDFDGIDDSLEISGTEKMPLLFDGLKKAHLTEAVIDKICYGNAMRLFKTILQ